MKPTPDKGGRSPGAPARHRSETARSETAGSEPTHAFPAPSVRLDRFDNSWYDPGRGIGMRVLWMAVSRLLLETRLPWPSGLKASVLRLFGARVGRGAVIKPRVQVKYPWHLTVGDHAWIGEGVWIDNLTRVEVGSHACLSQGSMIETGSHDHRDPRFGLVVRPVRVEDGAWVCARALLLPGSRLGAASVLTAGSVLRGEAAPGGIYSGNPAVFRKERGLSPGAAESS